MVDMDGIAAELAALRSIVATKDTCFGAPRFDGTRLPVECVALLVEAGESVESVAEDYEISITQVQAAVHWWKAVGKELAQVWKSQNGRVDALERRLARIAAERDAALARVAELEGALREAADMAAIAARRAAEANTEGEGEKA